MISKYFLNKALPVATYYDIKIYFEYILMS